MSVTAGPSALAGRSTSVATGPCRSTWAGWAAQLKIGTNGGGATLTNSGTVRVACGSDPTAGSTFMPITLNGAAWTGGTVQAVGGTWNSNTGLFTASNVVAGMLGSATAIDLSVSQRVLWNDGKGNTLGASFPAAASSNVVDPVVTALGGSAKPSGLAYNQIVLGDWSLSGLTASSSNPVYLSLWAGNPALDGYTLWAYNGSNWSQITAPGSTTGTVADDLAFDGTSYGFTLLGTGTGGNGLDFNGYDYAVVGTPILAGDCVLEGKVNVNDLTVVLTNFGKTGQTWLQGSMNDDPTGTVDVNDLTLVLANFGTTYGASSNIKAVPEPTCLALLGIGAASLLAFARRKRRAS